MHLFAVLEHDGQVRLLLNLFLKIKCLGVRALERRRVVLHRVRERIFGVRIVTALARGKARTHQLACAVEGVCVLEANGIYCVSHAGSPVLHGPWLLLDAKIRNRILASSHFN